MKNLRNSQRGLAWILAVLLLCISCAAADEGEYKENDLNFVEESMDPSGGIPADAAGGLARIREKGVLRVGTACDWPPQNFIDPEQEGAGRYAGADLELARLIALRMGVRLEIILVDDFSNLLPRLSAGDFDLAVSALSFSPERGELYTMSKGYYFSDAPRTVLVIRTEDEKDIVSVEDGGEDLKGRTVIAQRGSIQESMVAARIKNYKEFRRIAVSKSADGAEDNLDPLFNMVKDGKADALAMDAETAEAYLAAHPDSGLMLAEGITFELDQDFRGDRIAAQKGEYMLMYFVNGVIDEVLDQVPETGEAGEGSEAPDGGETVKGQYSIWLEEAEARWAEIRKQDTDARDAELPAEEPEAVPGD